MKIVIFDNATDISVDVIPNKGEDQSNAIDAVSNALIEVTTDYINDNEYSEEDKEALIDSLCNVIKETIMKGTK